jgi:hypothetical protein
MIALMLTYVSTSTAIGAYATVLFDMIETI